MKIGDLVKPYHKPQPGETGLVIDVIEKKVWRTDAYGKSVNWNKVKPEPHAVVLWNFREGTISMPTSELEVINGNR